MLVKSENMKTLLSETELLNSHLQNVVHEHKQENKTLNITVTVITGALWALFWQRKSFCIEKRILVNLVTDLRILKKNMVELCETLCAEMKNKHEKQNKATNGTTSGILRFRVAVVTVLAANRFFMISSFSKTIGNVHNGHCNVVCYGIVGNNRSAIKGLFLFLFIYF